MGPPASGETCYGGSDEEELRRTLQRMDRAFKQYSSASRFHLFELFLGFALAICVCILAKMYYEGALSKQQKKHRLQRAAEALEDMNPDQLKDILRKAHIDLPSWLTIPDFERVSWLNNIIGQLWPRISTFMTEVGKDIGQQVLEQNAPRWITKVKLTRLTAGDKPAEVSALKVYQTPDQAADVEEINIECDVLWNSQADAQLVIKPMPKQLRYTPLLPAAMALSNLLVLKIGVEDLTMSGRVRLSFRPLLSKPPFVGAVKVSLMRPPRYQYRLDLYGGDLTLLPGIEAWLDSLINETVIERFMIPEGYIVQLVPGDLSYVNVPKGMLFVQLIEAVNLPKTDWLGSCDPYVVMWTRPHRKFKSPVVHNAYHPVWDKDGSGKPFVFLVNDPDAQALHLQVKDWDFLGDEKVGHATLPISSLHPGETQDMWIELDLEADKDAAISLQGQGLQTRERCARTASDDDQDNQSSSSRASSDHHTPSEASSSRHREGRHTSASAVTKSRGYFEDLDLLPKKIKQGLKMKRDKGPPKVHLKVTYESIARDKVERARTGEELDTSGGADTITDMLAGGILYLYIKKAHNLKVSHLPFVLGGFLMKHKLECRVKLGDQEQHSAPGMKTKDGYTFDDELEFIVPGHDTKRDELDIHIEVWDKGLTDEKLGMIDFSFQEVRRHGRSKGSFSLKGAKQGELELDMRWVTVLGEG